MNQDIIDRLETAKIVLSQHSPNLTDAWYVLDAIMAWCLEHQRQSEDE